MKGDHEHSQVITVGVVAVVGILIMLFVGFYGGIDHSLVTEENTASTNDLVGQATRLTKFSRAVDKVEEKLVFVDFEQVWDHYGENWDPLYEKNGNQVCSDLGYSGCTVAYFEHMKNYYESTDNSCTDLLFVTQDTSSQDCSYSGRPPLGDCRYYNGEESIAYDFSVRSVTLKNVICKK